MARRRGGRALLFARLLRLAAARARPFGQRAGFVRIIFPAGSSASLVAHRCEDVALERPVFASGYGMLAAGMVFWRNESMAGIDTAPSATTNQRPGRGWLVLAMATVFELLAYELAYWFGHLSLSSHSRAVGISQSSPFRGSDDDAGPTAPASGRIVAFINLIETGDRNCLGPHVLRLRPGGAAFHAVQRQYRR